MEDVTDHVGAKIVFLQFRQQTETLQGVLVASGEKDEHQVSKQMLKFAQGIPVSTKATAVCRAVVTDFVSPSPSSLWKV